MTKIREAIKILLVEDQEVFATGVAKQLQGYSLLSVSTGEAAGEQLLLGDYQMILLKEELPFTNGLTMLHHIRGTLRSSIPVVMIFEKEDLDLIHFASQAGMSDYVLRPELENTTILPRLIDHILKRHRLESTLVEVQRRMQEVALIDPLTQVYNRSYFDQSILTEVARAKSRAEQLSLVMVDIDNFKQVNDQYGHLVGDVVLKTIANLIKINLRPQDVLCRYGGDEFLLLFPDTGQEEALQICNRFQHDIQQQVFTNGNTPFHVTVSIGLIPFSSNLGNHEDFLHEVDRQLYSAKRLGKNCIYYN